MRSLRLRLTLLAGLALAACQSDQEKLAEHMARGDAYLEEAKYPEAIIEYKSALQIDPNQASAHWGLARAHQKNQQPREGFWELRETVRLDPSNLEARLQFGQFSVLAGEFDEALKQADEVIAMDPSRVRAYTLRAQTLEAMKKLEKARTAYQKALEIAPGTEDEAFAVNLLANFHDRRGEREQAGPLYRRLTQVRPDFASYRSLAGFLVQGRDADAEAEEAYQKALEVAEADERALAYGSLAGFYFTHDRFDESVKTLETGIEELEENLDLIYLLARFYNMTGQHDKADALVEQATQEKPDDPRPYLILSTYHGRRGRLEQSLAAAEKALELDPENEEARLRKAELLVDIGFRERDGTRIGEGRGLVEAILQKNPSQPTALVVKAKIEIADGQPRDAVTALHSALDSRPDWAQAHFLLGSALALQGDRTASRTELARALELDAGLLEARKVLAQVHQDLAEHEYAVEEGRRFLKERPGDVATRITVAQSLVQLGRREEALRELEQIPKEERGPRVLYAFGQMYLALGQPARSREFLEQADAAMPGNPDILRALLALDGRENRFAESVKRIDAAVQSKPEDGRLQQLKGIVALASGRGDEAEEAFKKAIQYSPDDLSGYERLATYYGRTGRLQQALETYQQAAQRHPERAQLHYMLGVLHEYNGQREPAIASYEEAIRKSPDLGEAKNNLAYLFAEAGQNLDRALDLAQEAKALLPDSPNAADTLGWVLYKRGVPSAAIGFLREAESGMEPGEPSLGVVRHHLALAYEANQEPEEARKTVARALADLEASQKEARAHNRPVGPEPSWAADMRVLLARLDAAAPG
jgi:tetratricopeptide (TPR) repeat protein